jgi:peptide methionine sulfoxide reductase MsrB
MISYAQNFEDIILWRALKNIKNGFYVDVGAGDPVNHSVTKWFYDQGWSGVNIKPNEQDFVAQTFRNLGLDWR